MGVFRPGVDRGAGLGDNGTLGRWLREGRALALRRPAGRGQAAATELIEGPKQVARPA
ncbi:hypothetical protein DFAR_3690044 [Desulfarculales bacterium]